MKSKLILIPLIAIAFFVRWYKVDSPVADWHSWRQADTASVSQVYINRGIDLLHPRYHDLSNIPAGKENPEGYRMVEFPLYNALHASAVKMFPSMSVDQWGRTTSILYSLVSLVFLFLILEFLSGTLVATLGGLYWAVLPFNIFYSRVILPEPLMTALSLGSMYLFLKRRYMLSALMLALALLVKPYAIFFTLPLIAVAVSRYGVKRLLTSPWTYLYLAIAVTPLLAWREWIKQFPEGVPASDWLYNKDGIRFRPAWFRWLFGERIGKLILGYWGTVPLVLGLLFVPKSKENWFYHFWFLGVLLYLAVFAGGNVQHDYYQAIIIPCIVALMAKGSQFLLTSRENIIWPLGPVILSFCLFLTIFLGWYQIKDYYLINRIAIVEAGQKADQILPKDAKVIAPYQGDTAFLYQTRRSGWPAITTDFRKMMEMGATHYIAVNYDVTTNEILNDGGFEVLERNPDYLIVKLK